MASKSNGSVQFLPLQTKYLVNWKGYSCLFNSWEPEENLNKIALRQVIFKPQTYTMPKIHHRFLKKLQSTRVFVPSKL